MPTVNYYAFAIPAFFLFVYIEFVLSKKDKEGKFKYDSTVANFSIGIAERLLNLFIAATFYQLYVWIYNNYALFNIPNTWYIWVLLLLTTDFVWYWYHRLGHEVNFLWAAHIVHHQSEEFNLSVAARITTIQAVFRNFFWCVLPFIGFNPLMILTILVVHGGYSFFTHTQMIKRIKWLEYVFITPSLHGVHHASNEKYLDKNYGDVFVFWDKMFGTFQVEEEKPSYGLTHPIKSYSFLWQHFHYYLEIAEAFSRAKGISKKLKIVFGSPAVMDQEIRLELEKKYNQNKVKKGNSLFFRGYINVQLFAVVALLMYISIYFTSLNISVKIFVLMFIILSLINIGALIEQRIWIYFLECARLITCSFFVFYTIGRVELTFLVVLVIAISEKLFSLSSLYNKYVFRNKLVM